MADLKKSLNILFRVEYSSNVKLSLSEHKKDSGGLTYKGIARNKQPKWEGWSIIDDYMKNSNNIYDLENNKYLQFLVFNFYEENFWNKMLGYYIINQKIADNIFLLGVVTGMIRSIKIVQKICGIKEDGIFGKQTLKYVNQFNENEEEFIKKFNQLEIEHFKKLVEKNKNLEQFLNGWINRALVV